MIEALIRTVFFPVQFVQLSYIVSGCSLVRGKLKGIFCDRDCQANFHIIFTHQPDDGSVVKRK